MAWWNRQQKNENQLPAVREGFFSTQQPMARSGKAKAIDHAKNIKAILETAFQRSAEDDHYPPNYAMDSVDGGQPLSVKQLSRMGYAIPLPQLEWYAGHSFIGYQMCALIAQQWLVNKACLMPGEDASRHGYEITVNDGKEVKPEVLDFMRQADRRFGVSRNCVEFIEQGRTFGIRVAIFKVKTNDEKTYYEAPFNPDGIKAGSYMGISQVDPYWMTPVLDTESVSEPASIHFYEPTWWMVNGVKYHRSHLVIYRNTRVPDVLKPAYLYGGISIPQMIAERVYAAERVANEAPMLTMTKRLTVMNLDMTQALADEDEFAARMQKWTELMNNYGVKVIGGEETIEQFDTSLADLDATIMTQFQLVAAASGVPVTKLLGTTPKGFNATGEYDESSYHEMLESLQEHGLSQLVNRHHQLLIRSEVCPKFGIAPFNTEVVWNPVDSPTAMEQAELNSKIAQTDKTLAETGAIDGHDIRKRIATDKQTGYNGIEIVVPEGPGDREYEREMAESAIEGKNDDAPAAD